MVQKLLLYISTALLLVSCAGKSQLADLADELPPSPKNAPGSVKSGSTIASGSSNPLEILEDFFSDTVDAIPISFVPVVGNWVVADDEYNKLLKIDGTKSPQTEISDNLKELYQDRPQELITNLQSAPSSRLAIHKKIADFKEGELSVRFKIIEDNSDQSGGIIFGIQPDGQYLLISVDAVTKTLSLFDYQQGKLNLIEEIKNISPRKEEWQYLKIVVNKNEIEGFFNDNLYIKHTLQKPLSGRIGLWSKGESVIYFDNFRIIQPSANNKIL